MNENKPKEMNLDELDKKYEKYDDSVLQESPVISHQFILATQSLFFRKKILEFKLEEYKKNKEENDKN
jgi:hypothetical protein